MSILDNNYIKKVEEAMMFKNYVNASYVVSTIDPSYHKGRINRLIRMLGFKSATGFWNAFKKQYVGRNFAQWYEEMCKPYTGYGNLRMLDSSMGADEDVFHAVKNIIKMEPFDLCMFTSFTNLWMVGGLKPGGHSNVYATERTAEDVCRTSTMGKLYYYFPAKTPLEDPQILCVRPSARNILLELYTYYYEPVLNQRVRTWRRTIFEEIHIKLI